MIGKPQYSLFSFPLPIFTLRLSAIKGIQLLLIVLTISNYDPVAIATRGTDVIDFFNVFWRYRVGDIFCFFDFAIIALLVLMAWQIGRAQRLKLSRFDKLAVGLTGLVSVSIIVKALSQGEADTLANFLFEIRNYFYLLAIYFVTSRLNWTEALYQKMMKFVIALTVMIIPLSIFQMLITPEGGIISKYGRVAMLPDIDDFLLLMFTMLWLVVLCVEQFPTKLWQRVTVVGSIAYCLIVIFTGTSKGPLIIFPLYFGYIAWYYHLYRKRWVIVTGVILGLSVVLLAGLTLQSSGAVDQSSPLYVYTTFNAEDTSVLTRGIELLNFGNNMVQRNAFLQGIGIGNKWYEYVPQPPDGGAWPKIEQGTSWHFGMHVLLLRLILNFGLVGLGVFAYLFLTCFKTTLRYLRRSEWQPLTNAFVQASWLVISYQVIMNSLGGPKTNLITGFLLGTISGLLDATRCRQSPSGSSDLQQEPLS